MTENTLELRRKMDAVLDEVESGRMSNSAARVRIMAAKVILDTIKVEITAAALGRGFSPVSLSGSNGSSEGTNIRRIA